jgi:immune inhibitor A
MAHEFQHMIHWYRDRNEESWLNEGFSVLAELLNGFEVGGFDSLYVMNPDLQLTTWPGSAQLDCRTTGRRSCLWPTSSTALASRPPRRWWPTEDNGMDSIDAVLRR